MNKDEIDFMLVLKEIFYYSNEEEKIYPIIKNSNKIENFSQFMENPHIKNIYKINLLQALNNIFASNEILIPFFVSRCPKLYFEIINLYLSKDIKEEDINFLSNFIIYLNSKVSISKLDIELIYQRLGNYYRNKGKERLTEPLLIKYLKLLQLFYKDTKKENIDELSSTQKEKNIDNYIYFNGNASGISYILNYNSFNQKVCFPNLENGCSFFFWINLDDKLLDLYSKIIPNVDITLIKIGIRGKEIKLIIKDIKYLQLIIDKSSSNTIDLSNIFKFNEWNNICFVINKLQKNSLIAYVNSEKYHFNIFLPKDFTISENIETISCFHNLIGKVSSIFFFSFPLEHKVIHNISSQLKHGFDGHKRLRKFLKANDKDFLSNTLNKKIEAMIKIESAFNIKTDEFNIKNIISLFCPFAFNKANQELDDIFGNYLGVLSKEDGVNYFINYPKRIKQIGGINILLPIAEIMYSSYMTNPNFSFNLVDKNILTEKTLYEFLLILKNIIIGHKLNLYDANKNKFFSNLGLFLEKFPTKIFTENILDVLIEIGKEIFQEKFDTNSSITDNYINMILLNEKIFSKFTEENQKKLWDNVYYFFYEDYSQMKDTLNISKICLLLRFYDEKRYYEYCCTDHANIFSKTKYNENSGEEEKMKIMSPEMNEKVDKLFDTIQIYINKLDPEKETINLYKFLTLDISPCLQKKIIQVYISHFSLSRSDGVNQLKTLNNLLENGYIEITEYALSISLLDVRITILTLFKLILSKFWDTFFAYVSVHPNNIRLLDIYNFIGENLLPDKLMVEIDKRESKDDKYKEPNPNFVLKTDIPIKKRSNSTLSYEKINMNFNALSKESMNMKNKNLVKYLNKNIYNAQINMLYKFLSEWLLVNVEKDKKIISFVIDFLIMLVSKLTPNYIDTFTNSLLYIYQKENIINKNSLYDNRNPYLWLIETIFHFTNSENVKLINDINTTNKIQSQTWDILGSIFTTRSDPNDIYYILDYAYHMKKFFKDEINKNNVERTTRILLEKVMGVSSGNKNIATEICFEFMIFYKNSEILFKDLIKKIKKNSDNIIGEEDEGNKNIIIEDDSNNNIINTNSKLEKNDARQWNIVDGLFYTDDYNNSKEDTIHKSLVEIWKDFSLYDNIIDYYQTNFWGIEHICKKVNIEYDGQWITLASYLLKEYGNANSKKNKNILLEEILVMLNYSRKEKTLEEKIKVKGKEKPKAFNIKSIIIDKSKIINTLNLNFILLYIAIEITKDNEQKEFLLKQFQQFIIFCILASININNQFDDYQAIQNYLYNIIGYGFIYLKKTDEKKQIDIVNNLIKPIIKEVNDEINKGGIGKLFGIEKKTPYRSTAVYNLFITLSPVDKVDKKNKEPEELNLQVKKSKSSLINDNLEKDRMFMNDPEEKEIPNKKGAKTKAYFQFKGNETTLANNIFQETFNIYKKNRKNDDKRLKIQNFYEIYRKKEDSEKNIIEEKKKVKEKIKELVPLVEEQIRKYSNTSYIQEKLRRNNYKKTKKKLFSWGGFWSDRQLFFKNPQYLKVKSKNHLTKEMIRPLLSPILDVHYYIPDFSRFDKTNLFNKKDKSYYIKLNIDEILEGNPTFNKNNNINNNDSVERVSIDTNYNKYNLSSNFHSEKNIYGFNYLECLYKLHYDDIWEIYTNSNNDRISIGKKEANPTNYRSNSFDSSNDKSNENLILLEGKIKPKKPKAFTCCLVKQTHHIKGRIILKKKFIQFIYEENKDKSIESLQEEIENDPNYDKELGCCYGSIVKGHKTDKDITPFMLEYTKIKFIFLRIYFYQDTAFEIYTTTNKSYFFNFKTKDDMHTFLNQILELFDHREIKSENKRVLGFEQLFNPTTKKKAYNITTKMEEWQNYSISTLEYLMWLNLYAGRSYHDLTQYPVIPWVICDYTAADLNYKEHKRDLSLPMGMIGLKEIEKSITRKETYIDTYDTLKEEFKATFPDFNFEAYLQKGDEYFDAYRAKKLKMKMIEEKKNNESFSMSDTMQINQIPYYFGSHYSNPTYVCHYLTRIFPYAFSSIEIQGDKFDSPDRLFIAIDKTFESACTLKDDVRELIPEFYSLCEMFINVNNLNLDQGNLDADGNRITINDIEIPLWANKNPYIFVSKMRKFLENYDEKLNKWIDLIFGSYQRGEKAEEVHNIFMAQTYEKMVKIDEVKDPDLRNTLMRLNEVGITPHKIFSNDSKPRIEKSKFFQKHPIYSPTSGKFLYESDKLICIDSKIPNYIKKFGEKHSKRSTAISSVTIKIISMKQITHDTLRIFTSTNQWFDCKIYIKEKVARFYDLDIKVIPNNSSTYQSSFQIALQDKIPMVVYANGSGIIKGGFWDGRIELNRLVNEIKEPTTSRAFFSKQYRPITIMKMSEDEKYLICGTEHGVVLVYEIQNKINPIYMGDLYDHFDEITSIDVNDNLNMFATVSKDGYLILYTLPTLEQVRAIKLSVKLDKKNKEEKDENKKVKENDIDNLNKNEIKEENGELKDKENKEIIIDEQKEKNKDIIQITSNEKRVEEENLKKEEENKKDEEIKNLLIKDDLKKIEEKNVGNVPENEIKETKEEQKEEKNKESENVNELKDDNEKLIEKKEEILEIEEIRSDDEDNIKEDKQKEKELITKDVQNNEEIIIEENKIQDEEKIKIVIEEEKKIEKVEEGKEIEEKKSEIEEKQKKEENLEKTEEKKELEEDKTNKYVLNNTEEDNREKESKEENQEKEKIIEGKEMNEDGKDNNQNQIEEKVNEIIEDKKEKAKLEEEKTQGEIKVEKENLGGKEEKENEQGEIGKPEENQNDEIQNEPKIKEDKKEEEKIIEGTETEEKPVEDKDKPLEKEKEMNIEGEKTEENKQMEEKIIEEKKEVDKPTEEKQQEEIEKEGKIEEEKQPEKKEEEQPSEKKTEVKQLEDKQTEEIKTEGKQPEDKIQEDKQEEEIKKEEKQPEDKQIEEKQLEVKKTEEKNLQEEKPEEMKVEENKEQEKPLEEKKLEENQVDEIKIEEKKEEEKQIEEKIQENKLQKERKTDEEKQQEEKKEEEKQVGEKTEDKNLIEQQSEENRVEEKQLKEEKKEEEKQQEEKEEEKRQEEKVEEEKKQEEKNNLEQLPIDNKIEEKNENKIIEIQPKNNVKEPIEQIKTDEQELINKKEDKIEQNEELKSELVKNEIIEEVQKDEKKTEKEIIKINESKEEKKKELIEGEINTNSNIKNIIDNSNIKENIEEKKDEEYEKEDEDEDEKIYADNVFLSSSPLPCVTVYIAEKQIFRTYTLNGQLVAEEKEVDDYHSKYIKSPIIFKNLYLQEFLIYGTDKGYVKIRSFPDMKIVGDIVQVSKGESIECLEISKDKRFCFAWIDGGEIKVIKDLNASFNKIPDFFSKMGVNANNVK